MKIDWLLVQEILEMNERFSRFDSNIQAHAEMMQERGWIDNSTLRSPAGELMLETLRPRKKLKTVLSLLEKKGTPASEEIVCALMERKK
jgi:hypothetical protein